MKSKAHYQKIYEQLGGLFYAIAMADGEVRPRELDRLKELVQADWLVYEDTTDEFGTDAAHYITIAFDYLADALVQPQDAFERFAGYYHIHQMVFSGKLKNKIRDTATKIADAFMGVNKAELVYLEQLNRLFEGEAVTG